MTCRKTFFSRRDGENHVGAEYREGSCALCDAQSRPIRFVGDQFLADAIRYDAVPILRDDAPKGLREFMEAYHGHDGFGLSATASDGDTFRRVDIDASRLALAPRFQSRFIELLATKVAPALQALDEKPEAAANQGVL